MLVEIGLNCTQTGKLGIIFFVSVDWILISKNCSDPLRIHWLISDNVWKMCKWPKSNYQNFNKVTAHQIFWQEIIVWAFQSFELLNKTLYSFIIYNFRKICQQFKVSASGLGRTCVKIMQFSSILKPK